MMTAYFFGSSIRMPPIFTNSASTPATFIELIFSTSAGGNLFSIPKRIPIVFTNTLLARVGRTLLSDAVDVVVDFDFDFLQTRNQGQNQRQHQLQRRRTRVSDPHDTKNTSPPSAAKAANHVYCCRPRYPANAESPSSA